MASVSETDWPYVQHRGEPAGFLKTLDDRTLAFVDYRANLADFLAASRHLLDQPTQIEQENAAPKGRLDLQRKD